MELLVCGEVWYPEKGVGDEGRPGVRGPKKPLAVEKEVMCLSDTPTRDDKRA